MKSGKNSLLSSTNALIFIVLLLVGLFTFSDHLKFGLNSDEYRVLLLIKNNVHFFNSRSLSVFIQPYGGQAALMFILNLLFGYNARFYFVSSLVLRIIAAFSIYLLGRCLFKNKFIGFAASLIFMVSYAGVQTEGPVNSVTYISLAVMNFGLINYFNFLARKNKKIIEKGFLVSCLLFFLAYAINPIRIHGLIFLFIVIQISAVILKISKVAESLIQTVFFLGIIVLIKQLGFVGSMGTAGEVSKSLLDINYLLKIPNPLKTILYPLASFYQIIFIPEFNPLQKILPISLSDERISMFLGGFMVFLIFFLIIKLAKTRKKEAMVLTVLLAWHFCFSLIPHLAYPGIHHDTISRYFTIPVAGISLLVSYLLIKTTGSLLKNTRLPILLKIGIPTIILATILIENFSFTRAFYKSQGEGGNYEKYIDNAFNVMNKEIGDRSKKARPIAYLESDDFYFSYRSITEGGEERFSLLNNNLSENVRPFFVTNWEDLIAIYCMRENNLNPKIDDIFAFKVKNKTISIETQKVRENLTKIANDRKNCQIKVLKTIHEI